MKLIILGDSISKGTYTNKRKGEISADSVASPNFAQHLQRTLGAKELINLGMNGISYSTCSSVHSQWALSKTYTKAKDGDVIILAAGTNDYGTNVEIGHKEDTEDVSFFGAVDVVFRGIKQNNPNAAIYVILPIPRQNEEANEKGYVLDDYRLALAYKAKIYGLFVIDGRNIGIDPKKEKERLLYMDDGLHPNVAGHKLYGDMVCASICREGEHVWNNTI